MAAFSRSSQTGIVLSHCAIPRDTGYTGSTGGPGYIVSQSLDFEVQGDPLFEKSLSWIRGILREVSRKKPRLLNLGKLLVSIYCVNNSLCLPP